jgi:OLD-like protein
MRVFAPVFRVREPDVDVEPLRIPPESKNNWFDKGWAWDTTAIGANYEVPLPTDRTQEAYYSIFQIDHLEVVLCALTLELHLDSYIGATEPIDWDANGNRWMDYSEKQVDELRCHEFRRSRALLCQAISNRYYPHTQGDKRTVQVPTSHSSDHWTVVNAHRWSWHEAVRVWDPKLVETQFSLTPAKLRHAYEGLAFSQAHIDPIESWYQLTQFVSLDERKRLKGDALRAQTLREGAHMLRLLYKDLYGEELPHFNEVMRTIITPIPELEVRRDARRYLEFVANRYHVNPQPKVVVLVEGESEKIAIDRIFSEWFDSHYGNYGIEIIVLGGVSVATGSKQVSYGAIIRLIDYLHHHQSITFLVLDDEGFVRHLTTLARKAKSIHHKRRYVTRGDYIKIWRRSFELDNFSNTEIAKALDEVSQETARFTAAEVSVVKQQANPGAGLKKLFKQKTRAALNKILLTEALLGIMFDAKTRRKPSNRPIVKLLARVARNPFPTMQEVWERNQTSKYLGKKR